MMNSSSSLPRPRYICLANTSLHTMHLLFTLNKWSMSPITTVMKSYVLIQTYLQPLTNYFCINTSLSLSNVQVLGILEQLCHRVYVPKALQKGLGPMLTPEAGFTQFSNIYSIQRAQKLTDCWGRRSSKSGIRPKRQTNKRDTKVENKGKPPPQKRGNKYWKLEWKHTQDWIGKDTRRTHWLN